MATRYVPPRPMTFDNLAIGGFATANMIVPAVLKVASSDNSPNSDEA